MAHTETQRHGERRRLRWCYALALVISSCFLQMAHAQSAYSPGQILVKFRNAKPALAQFRDLSERYGITSIEPLFTPRSAKAVYPHPMTHVYRVRLSGDPIAAAADYALRPDVVYAQPNYLFTHQQAPNDPRYGNQRSLQTLDWELLQQSLGSIQKQIVVAIIDSGVDYNHEDLRDNIWHNAAEVNGAAGVDDDGNGYIDDIRGWDFTHAPDLPEWGIISIATMIRRMNRRTGRALRALLQRRRIITEVLLALRRMPNLWRCERG